MMMRKKRILTGILSLAFCFSMLFAMSATASASGSGEGAGGIWAIYDGSFSKAWQLYHSGDSGRASLTYGYNTFAVHEDYAWANHSTKKHRAAVARNNQTYKGTEKVAGTVSKKEIPHMTPEVAYYCFF